MPEGPAFVFPIVPHNSVSILGSVLRTRKRTGRIDEPITLPYEFYLVVDNMRLLLL